MAFLVRSGRRRNGGVHRLLSSFYMPSYAPTLPYVLLFGKAKPEQEENSWQRCVRAAKYPLNGDGSISFSTMPLGCVRLYSQPSQPKEKERVEQKENENDRILEGFKHQQIEGPTVERDMCGLANEVREQLKHLRKSLYDLSNGMLFLGVAQLSCGAWLHWITNASPLSEISVQSFFAFALPFTFAYLLRQVLKPMTFFTKMEEQGRLQILTLALQITKGMTALCQRLKVVAILCGAGISIGLLAKQWLPSGST
ncbi:hypothetical protein KI387_002011 [Taxus chinensis]|uniref:Uncharacterized protein n=1 Tax=Taxus chinensis TaxID=29808 RepID=A0AA38GVM2_TAXCH|nr:hypothetical protein KI387_002011 [Taxus chinensis]